MSAAGDERLVAGVLAPLGASSRRYKLLLAALTALVGVGAFAYATQLRDGLAVTGMAPTGNKVMWGVYITNFVFFIGISHAGTLISAVLRVTKAGWRTPITRMAELITVVALSVGALMPIIDLGRPDRLLNVIRYGRWQSAILWDFLSITTYLVGSIVYLYLPLIPDLALVRDRLSPALSRTRRWLYRTLAVGWRDLPEQRYQLGRALGLMMIVIMPVAVSVHTVVSWIFSMTLRTGWNTAVFGVYFVAGAIYSGIAALLLLMAVLRRAFHLEEWITRQHFVNLGYLMAALSLLMIYFNVSEVLTEGYKLEGSSPTYLREIFTGAMAPYYWLYFTGGLVVPAVLMLVRPSRTVPGVLVAAGLVTAAMWVERYIIVVASLRVPQMPYPSPADYAPSWVEVGVTAGAFGLFGLVIAVLVKVVPVVSLWEVREHEDAAAGVGTLVVTGAVVPEPS